MAHAAARRGWRWLPPVIYMLLIFCLSSQSDPIPELTARVWDKLLHTGAYAALGLLWCRALRGEGLGWVAAVTVALVATSAYGASDEWHQSFVPLRNSDIHDWFADTFGGAAGAAAYAIGAIFTHGSHN